MKLQDSRLFVAGATGEVGARLVAGLAERGAKLVLGGRDADLLAELGDELSAPTVTFDARDPSSCRKAVEQASDTLGGLDGLVVALGVAAFGRAEDLSDDVARQVFEVNVLGPMALVGEALTRIGDGGTIAVLSAIVADHPTADMAAYSASKAALSAYLAAVRRERRRQGTHVLDVRPQHMETGFADRALAGTPPTMPEPLDVDAVVAQILDALPAARREIAYDLKQRELVTR